MTRSGRGFRSATPATLGIMRFMKTAPRPERRRSMKKGSTALKSKTKRDELKTMKDVDVDLSDVPEINPKMFKTTVVRMPKPKELVSIRIDPDVLAWFRQQGALSDPDQRCTSTLYPCAVAVRA